MSTVLGVPGVWDVAAHFAVVDAALPRCTADGRWRICYTHPTLGDVLMSPSAGAVKITRWLFPLGSGPKRTHKTGVFPHKTGVIHGLRASCPK